MPELPHSYDDFRCQQVYSRVLLNKYEQFDVGDCRFDWANAPMSDSMFSSPTTATNFPIARTSHWFSLLAQRIQWFSQSCCSAKGTFIIIVVVDNNDDDDVVVVVDDDDDVNGGIADDGDDNDGSNPLEGDIGIPIDGF